MPSRPDRPVIVGVLDVTGGRCVHADGGDRATYRPIGDVFGDVFGGSSDPLAVGRRLLDAGAGELYLADLDALAGQASNVDAVAAAASLGVPVMVDGLVGDAPEGVTRIVSLEASRSPAGLAPGDVFSLDLRDGQPMRAEGSQWPRDPLAIAEAAIEAGCSGLIVLDVARVGTGQISVGPLLTAITRRHPNRPLISGGGVRTWDDVVRLHQAGCSRVLVGTALHRRTLHRPG